MSYAFGRRNNPAWDALRVQSMNRLGGLLSDNQTPGLGLTNSIYVWHADGSDLGIYDPDSAGLTSALTVAASGDMVWLPACTISGDYTIPAGVALVGLSREQSILTGQITLAAAAIIISVAIIRSGTSANLTCLVGPGSGAARAVSCKLSVTTTSGTPLAASSSGANTLYLEDCDISAIKSSAAVTPFAAASETLVDTFSVNSATNAYQAGTYATSLTKSYRVEVSGSIQWESPSATRLADANYTTLNGWSTYSPNTGIVFSDGSAPVSDSGVYESSHVYNFTRPGTGAAFAIRFADSDYTDNVGSFTVNVYEIEQAGINLEGCVFNGAWLGISEWGDRAARDAFNYPSRHANDIGTGIHWTQAELDARYATSPGLEWFDVKTYGAVGDGTADDTTAITAAITAIPASGGVLYFPAGTYKVTSGLTLNKPITVRGDGSVTSPTALEAVSQISFTSATESLFTVASHGCSFYDLSMVNYASPASAGAAITVTATGLSMRFSNLEISLFYIGIDMQDGGSLWTMDGILVIAPVKYGVKIANPTNPDAGDWSISNSFFVAGTYNADAAIRLESSGGGKITNVKINVASGAFANGIDMAVTAGVQTTILVVSNSSIENISGDGFHLRNTATSFWNHIIINGVHFGLYSNTGGHAVSIVGVSASHFNDIIIDSCVFRATGSPGSAIDLQYVDAAYIGTYVNEGFSSLLTTSNTTDIKQIGLGSGTVTSIAAGTGITATPDPIVATGTIAIANTAVTPGSYTNTNLTVDQQGRITTAANGTAGATTLDGLSDVDTTGTGTGDIIYNNAGTWEDYPLGVGTNFVVTSGKLRIGSATNYLEIDKSTGNLRLVGDATAWDDIRITADVVKAGATAPNYKAFGPSGNLQALMFEAGHHDEATFSVQLPHQWKEGSRIYPHVHWTPTTADAGNVVWELEYSWANINGTFGAPGNMATDATAAGGTAWVHKLTDLKESGNNYISGTGKTMSSMLVCRIHRNSNSGSDTLNKDVALLELDFHYEIDSFGSDTADVKDTSAALLLEDGSYLLLEDGGKLLLE